MFFDTDATDTTDQKNNEQPRKAGKEINPIRDNP
jgi:hypothetical protein